jgi:uncharacterized protein YfaS (alpha-2-macroglobulin family)
MSPYRLQLFVLLTIFSIATHSQQLRNREKVNKKLMVQPNAPRFLREGDKIEFTSKIVNLGDSELTGQAELQLIDPTSNQSVNGWFQNIFPINISRLLQGKVNW